MKNTTLALIAGVSIVLAGCATSVPTKNGVSLNFNYQFKREPQGKTNRSLILIEPKIIFSKNISPNYREKFEKSLKSQVEEMFKAEGYQVINVADKNTLSTQDKKAGYLALAISGHIDVLEDTKLKVEANTKNLDQEGVDTSSGFLRLEFFEPMSLDILHTFNIDLSKLHAKTHYIKPVATNSGGFMTKKVVHSVSEDSYDDGIKKILNQIYAKTMKKIDKELSDKNIDQYEKALKEVKNKTGN
ncbi:hypothetical protein BKH41_05315 [Helicobacter sp. 12S02232-10]|uniref:HpaA family protein n=1 Tax=Helicobacter sp. 12S02232-10 TaxID=1476197 RepID=UPI000BA6D6B4|nr:HpaA family protein [Helicobacter sp. 12S02232-10]PAF48689.1 hypothetical protein BKH41_05315 [Helicobacter sp. 12S02232-10]